MAECQSKIVDDCSPSNATIKLADGRLVCTRCAVFSSGWIPKAARATPYPPRDAAFTTAHDPRDWDGIAAKAK